MTIEQPELDFTGVALARKSDPGTSHAAAREVRGERANRLERQVLAAIEESKNGLTMHEICSATGLPWNTASPRIRPMIGKGLVEDSGTRRQGHQTRCGAGTGSR